MKVLYMVLSFLFSLLFANAQKRTLDHLLKKYDKTPRITVEEIQTLEDTPLLLDTRTHEEYTTSHIKHAVFTDYDTFSIDSISKRYPNKNKSIVVYCSLGIRSDVIGEKLITHGYTNVKNLYGGIFYWKNKGYPVYNMNKQKTDSMHVFSKKWSIWLEKGLKVHPKRKQKSEQ